MKADVIEKIKKSLYLGKQQIGHVYSGHPTTKQVESHLRESLDYLIEVDKLLAELSSKSELCDICGAMHDLTKKCPKEEVCQTCKNTGFVLSEYKCPHCKPTCQTCGGSGLKKIIGKVVKVNGVDVQQYEKCDCQKSKSYCRNGDDCVWNKGEGCNRECEKLKPEPQKFVDVNIYIDQTQKIAEQQKEIERLREALKVLAKLGNGDKYGNSDGNMIARKALEGK